MHNFTINRWLIGGALAAVAVITAAIIVFANPNAEQSIPLSKMIGTHPQAKMRYLNDVFPGGESDDYQRKFLSFHTNASNVFLVDASNERDAISASVNVMFGPMSADTAASVNRADAKRGSHWLAAYIGSGPSNPRSFVVENAFVAGDKIRLSYSKSNAKMATADIQRYYFWVPLGKLRPGVYYVELYDSSLKSATLSRRVEVKQEKSN